MLNLDRVGLIVFFFIPALWQGQNIEPTLFLSKLRDGCETLMLLWFVIGIVVDLAVGINAESNLRGHFRAAAAGIHTRPVLAADALPSSPGELAEA